MLRTEALSNSLDDLRKYLYLLLDVGSRLPEIVPRGSDRPGRSGSIRMYGSHTSGLGAGRGRRWGLRKRDEERPGSASMQFPRSSGSRASGAGVAGSSATGFVKMRRSALESASGGTAGIAAYSPISLVAVSHVRLSDVRSSGPEGSGSAVGLPGPADRVVLQLRLGSAGLVVKLIVPFWIVRVGVPTTTPPDELPLTSTCSLHFIFP
jgi:hypothetical protein